MKKKLFVVLSAIVIILGFSSCNYMDKAYEKAAENTFKVNAAEGSSALGMLKMMEPELKPNPRLGDTVLYLVEKSQDDLYGKLQRGEVDIGAIPTEMAAKLYNGNSMYKLAAVNTRGFIYVLANGTEEVSWSGLKGKEVNIAKKGSVEDTIFRYLLIKNGIDPDLDITIKYAESQEALYQLAINHSEKIAVLSEPLVSLAINKNKSNKVVLDLQKEWTRVNGSNYPLVQTCIVVKKEVAAEKSEALELFLKDYSDSLDWVNRNPTKAVELMDKHPVGVSRESAIETIKNSNFSYLSGKDARAAVEKYLQVLLDNSPDLIGGQLPDKDFIMENK